MLQTNAASMDQEEARLIRSKIAKLWKIPDLAHQIETFEPKPNPMQEQIQKMQLENAQLENQKIKMEMAKMAKDIESEDSKIDERVSRTSQNIESEAEENIANARFKNAQAAKLEEETDLLAQDFLRTQDGTKRSEFKEDKEFDRLLGMENEERKNQHAFDMEDTKQMDNRESSQVKFEQDKFLKENNQKTKGI